MKTIVICADGTWNTPDMSDNGVPAPTNVWKFYNAVAETDAAGARQDKYYHPGVGTEGGKLQRLIGGGTGEGLDKNIKSAYRWLAGTYQSGDRIFLLGFSRGAYTVRSLGGMISKCGLADLPFDNRPKQAWAAVDRIFDAYRADGPSTVAAAADLPFHNTQVGALPKKTTKIRFIGVWDTVGALGIPDDLAFLNLLDDPDKHRFHDTEISTVVDIARHAVAIDELRQSFLPTLWQPNPEVDMQQVWFPGVHGNIGGGYARAGLSDGALGWMVAEAQKAGLGFNSDTIAQIRPDPRDMLHDSLKGVFKSLKTRPRAVPRVSNAIPDPAIHASALERQKDPPITAGSYWPYRPLPATVDVFARELWNATGIYLEKGKRYRLDAQGEWKDAEITAGPAGTGDGKFQPRELLHVAGTAMGKLESLTRKLLKNEQLDFWLTKRVEDAAWFALIGVIANNHPPPKRKNDERIVDRLPHEVFVIGKGIEITPEASGYLYCFANDAWQTYGNNRGSLRLTVTERTP